MNMKRYWLATLVVFVAIMILGWLASFIAMPMYEATASLWRTPADQMHFFGWALFGTALFSIFFCLIYVKGFGNGGLRGGFMYGLYMALMFSFISTSFYMVLPISGNMAIWWAVSGFIETIIVGCLVGVIYNHA